MFESQGKNATRTFTYTFLDDALYVFLITVMALFIFGFFAGIIIILREDRSNPAYFSHIAWGCAALGLVLVVKVFSYYVRNRKIVLSMKGVQLGGQFYPWNEIKGIFIDDSFEGGNRDRLIFFMLADNGKLVRKGYPKRFRNFDFMVRTLHDMAGAMPQVYVNVWRYADQGSETLKSIAGCALAFVLPLPFAALSSDSRYNADKKNALRRFRSYVGKKLSRAKSRKREIDRHSDEWNPYRS